MSDGITDAIREDATTIRQWKDAAISQLLSTFTKEQLVGEICKREGVKELNVPDPDHGYTIHIYGKTSDVVVLETGAARIFVVID